MAFPPVIALALAGTAAWLLLAQKKTPAGSTGQLPAAATQPDPSNVITIPSTVVTDHPDVTPANTPTISVQVPSTTTSTGTSTGTNATGDKSDQVPVTPPPSWGVTPSTVASTATQVITQLPSLIQQGTTALQNEETKPDLDPKGTIALAKDMINAESSAGWKAALKPAIAAWQGRVGLKADGWFGPTSAQKMALEVGILPLLRGYPAGSQLASALKAYRDILYTMAANADNKNPAQAAALRSSALYETGQAYTGTPKAIPAQARLTQAAALKTALGT